MHAIVIVGASLRLAPYAFSYIDELLAQDADVTAFVWVRDGQDDIKSDERVTIVNYKELLDDAAPKKKKLTAFLRFRHAVLKELKNGHYDFVVALDTQFAVLLSDVLLKKYSNRFIYDMRDPSYEAYSFYRKRVAKIIKASAGTFISSKGFRKYLPNSNKIHITHNIQKKDLDYCGLRSSFDRNHRPIRISFWGCIRDREINEKLIDALANDKRFIIQYFGLMSSDSMQLVDYCKTCGINNVIFTGKYHPEERYKFVLNTELIHNVYPNDRANYHGSNPCMSNKYYDGIVFGIPQICLHGGFPATVVVESNVGCSVTINEKLGDILWEYYNSINWDEFNGACDKVLNVVLEEFDSASIVLKNIISTLRLRG